MQLRLLLAALLLWATPAFAQSPVAVTATIQSASGGQPYSYGTYRIQLVNASGNPISQFQINGSVQTQTLFTGSLSPAGALSQNLYANSAITTPAGTQWQFSVSSTTPIALTKEQRPSPSLSSFTLPVTITGAGDISSTLNAVAPAFNPCQQWGGASWVACGTGVSATPAGPAYAVNFANSSVSAFQGDSSITVNPSTHAFTSPLIYAGATDFLPHGLVSLQSSTCNSLIQACINYQNTSHLNGYIPSGTFAVPSSVNLCGTVANPLDNCTFPQSIAENGDTRAGSIFALHSNGVYPGLDFGGVTYGILRDVSINNTSGDQSSMAVFSSHGGAGGAEGDNFTLDHVNINMQGNGNSGTSQYGFVALAADGTGVSDVQISTPCSALVMGDTTGTGTFASQFYNIAIGSNDYTMANIGASGSFSSFTAQNCPAAQLTGSNDYVIWGTNYFTVDGAPAGAYETGILDYGAEPGTGNALYMGGVARTENHTSESLDGLYIRNSIHGINANLDLALNSGDYAIGGPVSGNAIQNGSIYCGTCDPSGGFFNLPSGSLQNLNVYWIGGTGLGIVSGIANTNLYWFGGNHELIQDGLPASAPGVSIYANDGRFDTTERAIGQAAVPLGVDLLNSGAGDRAFTGSISGTTLTVTVAPAIGLLHLGSIITGSGVTIGTVITAIGSVVGGNQTYTVNSSQTVASESMQAGPHIGMALDETTVAYLPQAVAYGELYTVTDAATSSLDGQTCVGGGSNVALAIWMTDSHWHCLGVFQNFSSSVAGLAPASGGGTTNFLRADGTWASPLSTPARGTATLISGTVTVSNSAACSVGSACIYKLTNCGTNSSVGIGLPTIGTITAGTSFVINSVSAADAIVTTDVSTICWQIN
jgi:hypothetical protein